MKFEDVPIGQRVVQVEKMGDADGTFEIRHTHYERADGSAKYFPERNVPCYRLRLTQGIPGEPPRFDSGEHRDLSEIPKALPVEPGDGYGAPAPTAAD